MYSSCSRIFLLLSILAFQFGPNRSAFSQEYDITVFDRSRGLNCNYVNDVIRDQRGFFWIGTDRGVFRFDGANFLPVPIRNGKQGEVVRMRLFRNELYVIYRNLRLVDRLDISDLSFGELATGDIADITQINDSTLVAFDRSGKMLRFRNGRKDLERNIVTAFDAVLTYWKGQVFLLAFGKDLYCVDPLDLRMVRNFGLDPNYMMRGGFQPLPDRLLVNFVGSIKTISPDLELRPFNPIPGEQFKGSHSLGYHSERLQYYLRSDRELVIAKDSRFKGVTFPGRRVPELRSLLMVDSVNLLIGTNGSLIHFRNQPPRVENFTRDDSLVRNQIRVRRNIIPMGRGLTILTGSPSIVRWENGKVSSVPYPQLLYFSDLTRLGSRVFGVGENKSVISYDPVTGKVRDKFFLTVSDEQGFSSITADTVSGTLIVGGNGALFKMFPDDDRIELITEVDEGPVNLIRRSADGDWWICTNNGLTRFDPRFNRKQYFSRDSGYVRLSGRYINDILIDGTDNFWVAHNDGAERVDLKRRMVTDSIPLNLLPDPRIACIRKDTLGRLWFSTFDGILAYDPATSSYIRLAENSGLINKEFNRRSGAFLADGRLMFGGDGGYDIIDPYAFRFERSRAVGRITAVEWYENSGKVRQSIDQLGERVLTFNTETESLRISISTLDPLEASSCRFQFRLNNGLWQNLEGKYHFEIFKLSPGDYTVDFRGFDRYGTLITFTPFVVKARVPFYRSVSFIVLILLALLASVLVILVIIWRNRRREQRLVEGISMDLHDEVGTILTRALMVSKTSGYPMQEQKIQGYLADALFRLRTYIRTMNKATVPPERFLADLRDMVNTTLEYTGVSFSFIQEGRINGDLSASLARDVKLCLFEMLNNVLKHSGAGKVSIAVVFEDHTLRVDLADDGTLAALDQLHKTGNGLINLEKRTLRHGGSIEKRIDARGHGLHVQLTFKR